MAEKGSKLPTNPKDWLEYARNIDYKDPKKAMVALGMLAAFGVGVGVYELSKGRGSGKFSIRYGDRHMEEDGVISVVELDEYGSAVSFPTSDEALKGSDGKKEIFAMGKDGFAYPNADPSHIERYMRSIKGAASWLVDHLSSQVDPSEAESGEDD